MNTVTYDDVPLGGLPGYIFIAMPFRPAGEMDRLFGVLSALVLAETGYSAKRGDMSHPGEDDVRQRVHALIQAAELVIVDISRANANVFYELGYAVAKRKKLVLIKRNGGKPYADVAGMEYFDYSFSRDGALNKRFRSTIASRLHDLLRSPVPLYREMLQGILPLPVFIAAHPKHPNPKRPATRIQYRDKKTFGDYLGVRGLLAANGAMGYDIDSVHLVAANFAQRDLASRDVNLCLVGSPKVNPVTGSMFTKLRAIYINTLENRRVGASSARRPGDSLV